MGSGVRPGRLRARRKIGDRHPREPGRQRRFEPVPGAADPAPAHARSTGPAVRHHRATHLLGGSAVREPARGLDRGDPGRRALGPAAEPVRRSPATRVAEQPRHDPDLERVPPGAERVRSALVRAPGDLRPADGGRLQERRRPGPRGHPDHRQRALGDRPGGPVDRHRGYRRRGAGAARGAGRDQESLPDPRAGRQRARVSSARGRQRRAGGAGVSIEYARVSPIGEHVRQSGGGLAHGGTARGGDRRLSARDRSRARLSTVSAGARAVWGCGSGPRLTASRCPSPPRARSSRSLRAETSASSLARRSGRRSSAPSRPRDRRRR